MIEAQKMTHIFWNDKSSIEYMKNKKRYKLSI